MKVFKNKTVALISLIVGILLVVYAVLSKLVDHKFFQLDKFVGNLILGIGLIVFAVLVVLPKISKHTNKTAKTLRIIEFIVLIVGALLAFLLPAFDVQVPSLGTGSLWIGLALVIHGGIDLYLGSFGKGTNKKGLFFINLTLVVLGGYIYGANVIDKNISLVSFVALLGTGVFLTLMGLLNVNSKSGK